MLVGVLFARYLLLSWVVLPVAGLALGKPVGMGEASFVPTRRLALSELRIGGEGETFLLAGPVEARYRLWRSLFVGPHIERFHADGLTVNLAHAPDGKSRRLKFRWFRRRRHKEDIEKVEPFLLQDLALRNGTIVYAREGAPFRLRIEQVQMALAELRHGEPARIETRGEVAELAYGPLRLTGGQLQGFCVLLYDREMDLQGSEFSFVLENLKGTFGEAVLDGLTVVVSGRTGYMRARGYEQDLRVVLRRGEDMLGSVSLVGYYTKNLATLDLTARVGIEAELANWLLAGWSLPPLDAPRLDLAARGRFPRPGEAEVALAMTLDLAGETVADLDVASRSPLPPLLQPARFRVTGERLAMDRLLALHRELRPAKRATTPPATAEPISAGWTKPVPLPRLVLPPALLDLDLRGVSFGDLAGTLAGRAAVHGSAVDVSACRIQLGEGALDLAGTLDWETEDYRAHVQGRSLDLGPLFRQFLAEDGGRIEGRLDSLSAAVAGRGLGESDWERLEGSFQAEVGGLALYQIGPLREAERKTRIRGLANLRFDRASLAGSLGGGFLHLAPLAVNGPSGRMEVSGRVGLADQELELALDAGLGPELARGLRRSSYSYLAFLLQPRDGYLHLPMPIHLRGTLGRPTVDVERLLVRPPAPL